MIIKVRRYHLTQLLWLILFDIMVCLFTKLFWPAVRKNCSGDWEKLLKLETEDQEFANYLKSPEKFIQQWKVSTVFWTECFFRCKICGSFFLSLSICQLFKMKNIIIWVKTLPYFTQMKRCDLMTFSWRLESERARGKSKNL